MWNEVPLVTWPVQYRKYLCRMVAREWAAVDSQSLFLGTRKPKKVSTWRLLAHVAGLVPTFATTTNDL